jgi:hypothetical protein
MRSGDFPHARCEALVTGFVVTLVLPVHPDNPVDSLYPKNVDGRHYRDWLGSRPGVLSCIQVERNGTTTFDLTVRADACSMSPEQFVNDVRDCINRAGFQW